MVPDPTLEPMPGPMTEPTPAPVVPAAGGRRRSSLHVMAGFGGTSVVLAVQTLLLVPLFVERIGARLYGAWLGSGDVLAWLPVADLGMGDVLLQRVAASHAAGDRRDVAEWVATGWRVMLAVAVVVGLVGAAGAVVLPGVLGLAGSEARALTQAFAVAAAAMSVQVLFSGGFAYARAVQRAGALSAANTAAFAAGFAVSLVWVLLAGGLAAIAAGFAARAAVQLASVSVFLRREGVLSDPEARFSPDKLRDLLAVTPLTALSTVAFLAMSQSEFFLVALLLGPETSVLYMVNRKAVDLARAFADSVVWGTYGAFAHLAGSDPDGVALRRYREILVLRTVLAVALAGAYIAVNASFVSVWVGPEFVLGPWLSVAVGVQAVVTGNAFLVNYLYRAAGCVREGAWLLTAESVVRVGLVVALVRSVGVIGVPLAGIATAAVALAVTHRRLVAHFLRRGAAEERVEARFWAVCAVVLALCTAAGLWGGVARWSYVLAGGGASFAVALALTGASTALFAGYRQAARARLRAFLDR